MSSTVLSGKEHLEFSVIASNANGSLSDKELQKYKTHQELLGTSLSAIYQVATCHRKCFGGGHVLEALSGRIYNLAVGAYQLARIGFYDEALNLTRSIAEITNLIAFSIVDKEGLTEWLKSDTKSRIRKFGPANIRKILEKHDSAVLIADKEWYSEFCEKYTHVTPETKPNLHTSGGSGYVGGVYDSNGLEKVLDELTKMVVPAAFFVSKYADLDDMFDEIAKLLDEWES